MFVYKIVAVNSKKGAIASEGLWTAVGAGITGLAGCPAEIAPPASNHSGEESASSFYDRCGLRQLKVALWAGQHLPNPRTRPCLPTDIRAPELKQPQELLVAQSDSKR